MAFSPGGKGPSSTLNEINVTPLVDVMLVLLIIFMISAPLLQSGVAVDLPKGNNELESNNEHLILSLNAEGKAYLNNKYLQPEIIVDEVKVAVATRKDQVVYLEADKSLPYGAVVSLLSRLRAAGLSQVSLITDPNEEGK